MSPGRGKTPYEMIYNTIILTAKNLIEINKVNDFLKTKFPIKDLGKLKFLLGLKL